MTLHVHRAEEGSFLVEAIISLSLVVAGILGIVVLLTRSLGMTASVAERTVAAYLAAEGIEVTRSFVDTELAKWRGWADINLPPAFEVQYNGAAPIAVSGGESARPLLFDAANGTYTYDAGGGTPTPFRRTIAVSWLGGGEEIGVRSAVRWNVKGTEEVLNLEDRFLNWRQR